MFSGLKLFLKLDHWTVEFFELFFIKLSIISHENIVDFEVILFEFVVWLLQILKGNLLSPIFSKEVFELWSKEWVYIFVFPWKFFGWKACLHEDCFSMTPQFSSSQSTARGFCLFITIIYFALRDMLRRSFFSTRCSLNWLFC